MVEQKFPKLSGGGSNPSSPVNFDLDHATYKKAYIFHPLAKK